MEKELREKIKEYPAKDGWVFVSRTLNGWVQLTRAFKTKEPWEGLVPTYLTKLEYILTGVWGLDEFLNIVFAVNPKTEEIVPVYFYSRSERTAKTTLAILERAMEGVG